MLSGTPWLTRHAAIKPSWPVSVGKPEALKVDSEMLGEGMHCQAARQEMQLQTGNPATHVFV